jgi:hypothetical protein
MIRVAGTLLRRTMITRTLRFDKDGHTYILTYARGMEDAAVEEVMRLADDRKLNFDWLDAATLSFQITGYAAEDVYGPMAPDPLAME